MKRLATLALGLTLAGCNSNAMGLDALSASNTPWAAYICTFIAGAIICPLIGALWMVYKINTSE